LAITKVNRQLQRYLNFDSLPDSTDKLGILPVAVVNPLTRMLYPAKTQIPVSALNPFAYALLGGLPTPNGPGRSNNYEALLLIRDYSDKFDAKIDGQINSRMTAFLRFSQRKDLQYYQPSYAGSRAAMETATFTRLIRMHPRDILGPFRRVRYWKRASAGRMFWLGKNRLF